MKAWTVSFSVLAYKMMEEIKRTSPKRDNNKRYIEVFAILFFTSSQRGFFFVINWGWPTCDAGAAIAPIHAHGSHGWSILTFYLMTPYYSLWLLHSAIHEATANWLMVAWESKPICFLSIDVYDDSVGLRIIKPHWKQWCGKTLQRTLK